ncbi:MAG: asparagine synthase (glutamine-hydrolyzing) [Saccharospirillum sp.]|nr:asparagine synthase (glutamine-hydrolyzing) [Saccharospirillum sp.]
MCGIAGLVSNRLNEQESNKIATKMSRALNSRGPDDNGYIFEQSNKLLLVHTRLAIHDLSSSGHQPMKSKSDRYILVYNGEIYNFQELRKTLIELGTVFSGTSDTEVLLEYIEQFGIKDTLIKCSGMFSFCLLDRIECKLYLCRDRLGEKPLYYGWIENDFFFCSQLSAIESIYDKSTFEICDNSLNIYLKYGYIPAPYSIYKGSFKLRPGTFATIDLNNHGIEKENINLNTYWTLEKAFQEGRTNQLENTEELVSLLDKKLRESIAQQLQADVNVGVFLSGGIDSSIVAAIAQKISKNKIKTFTVGFETDDYDESKDAERIANYLNTDHTTLLLNNSELLDIVPKLGSIYDEPFADSSQIPSFMISKKAREHVTVCLSGDGGDELFGGYNRYTATIRLWNVLKYIPYSIRYAIAKVLDSIPSTLRDKVISVFYKNKQGSLTSKIDKISLILKSKDLNVAYDKLLSYWHEPNNILKHSTTEYSFNLSEFACNTSEFFDYAMLLDQRYYLEGDNLVKTDRASMANSLETRLPLLSKDIVQLAWRIPNTLKIKDQESKWILKKTLYNYVPMQLMDRPKMGFSVPVADWLRNDLKTWAEDLLENVFNENDSHLKNEPIRQVWKEHQSQKADHSNKLWTILMFLVWKQQRNLK